MNNTTEITPDDIKARSIGLSIGVISIVLGTVGNSLTIVASTRNPGFQTVFNYFITNFAILDLVTSVLVLPFSVAGFSLMRWPLGAPDSPSASFHAYSRICCNYTSILCLLALTVNRFINVFHQKAYLSLFSKKRVYVVISTLWLIAPMILLPGLVGKDAAGRPIMGWKDDVNLCTFIATSGAWKTYRQIIRITFMVLPMCLMVSLHSAIFWKLDRPENMEKFSSAGDKMSTTGEACNLVAMNDLHLTEEESKLATLMKSKEKLKRHRTSSFVSFAMSLVFIALALPSIVIAFMEETGQAATLPSSTIVFTSIMWLKSCVNPIIYFALSHTYRVQYVVVLRYIWLKITCKL